MYYVYESLHKGRCVCVCMSQYDCSHQSCSYRCFPWLCDLQRLPDCRYSITTDSVHPRRLVNVPAAGRRIWMKRGTCNSGWEMRPAAQQLIHINQKRHKWLSPDTRTGCQFIFLQKAVEGARAPTLKHKLHSSSRHVQPKETLREHSSTSILCRGFQDRIFPNRIREHANVFSVLRRIGFICWTIHPMLQHCCNVHLVFHGEKLS